MGPGPFFASVNPAVCRFTRDLELKVEHMAKSGVERLSQPFVASVKLPQTKPRHLLSLVQYGMAQQDIRYYLNGLLLVACTRYATQRH